MKRKTRERKRATEDRMLETTEETGDEKYE